MFFHSFAAMLRPLLDANTPSPRALRTILRDFYANTSERLQQSLQQELAMDFSARHRELGNPHEWGDFEDALCLASIY